MRRMLGALWLVCLLSAAVGEARTVSPIPVSLGAFSAWPDFIGKSLYIRVTGSASGSVWGSGPYTSDSVLATAAVHAGLLRDGETGVVKVNILGPQTAYLASTAHGVSSLAYGATDRSYTLAADDGGDNPALPDPGGLAAYRGNVGGVYLFTVTGKRNGVVWGTNTYTDDTALSAAAVHAGVLADGASGIVRVVLVPGLASYAGSERNGIKSGNYGNWTASYTVSNPAGTTPLAAFPGMRDNPLDDPGSLVAYTGHIGAVAYFNVTAAPSGQLWGSGIYTLDSNLAAAVQHAGVLATGQRGLVKVSILPGQASYTGSSANGVVSNNYGNYTHSYTPARPDGQMGDIPLLSSATSASASLGSPFRYQPGATAANAGFIANGLPDGLTADPKTGLISGTPRVSGRFLVDLLVSNWVGTSSATLQLDIDAMAISDADLNSFFNWAEKTAASLFAPTSQTTSDQAGYRLRYYRQTNSYLGVKDGQVYYSGPLSGGSGLSLGAFAPFLAQAKAAGY